MNTQDPKLVSIGLRILALVAAERFNLDGMVDRSVRVIKGQIVCWQDALLVVMRSCFVAAPQRLSLALTRNQIEIPGRRHRGLSPLQDSGSNQLQQFTPVTLIPSIILPPYGSRTAQKRLDGCSNDRLAVQAVNSHTWASSDVVRALSLNVSHPLRKQ